MGVFWVTHAKLLALQRSVHTIITDAYTVFTETARLRLQTGGDNFVSPRRFF